jgi:hypothetical protein
VYSENNAKTQDSMKNSVFLDVATAAFVTELSSKNFTSFHTIPDIAGI